MKKVSLIERMRLRRGLTQEEVAKRACISRSHYCDLASLRVEPKIGTARRVARAMGYLVDELWPEDVDAAA